MPMIRTPASFLEDAVGLAQAFGLEKPFGRADRRPGDKDEGRVPQRVDKEQESAIKDVPLLRHEGQEHGQNGNGARRRNHAEQQSQQEGADIALLFHPDPGRNRDVQFEGAEQVQPHDQANPGDDVFPELPDIPEHPSHKSGDEPEHGEGDGQAQDEKERKDERAPERRRLLVPGDDSHQERDHGQNAGIQGRRHASQEDGDDRQPGAVLEERGNIAEEAFHRSSAHWMPCFFRSSRISSLGKSPTWRAISFPF